jgi:hypothetical protein
MPAWSAHGLVRRGRAGIARPAPMLVPARGAVRREAAHGPTKSPGGALTASMEWPPGPRPHATLVSATHRGTSASALASGLRLAARRCSKHACHITPTRTPTNIRQRVLALKLCVTCLGRVAQLPLGLAQVVLCPVDNHALSRHHPAQPARWRKHKTYTMLVSSDGTRPTSATTCSSRLRRRSGPGATVCMSPYVCAGMWPRMHTHAAGTSTGAAPPAGGRGVRHTSPCADPCRRCRRQAQVAACPEDEMPHPAPAVTAATCSPVGTGTCGGGRRRSGRGAHLGHVDHHGPQRRQQLGALDGRLVIVD